MKHSSTLFLKIVLFLLGALVLTLCLFLLPPSIRTTSWSDYRPLLLWMYLPALPFFLALHQTFKLLNLIDQDKAFSVSSVKALKLIKICAFTISFLYGLSLPYIYQVAQLDDAPGVVLLGLIFTFAPLVVGVVAAVLEKMFQDALKLKTDNDLAI